MDSFKTLECPMNWNLSAVRQSVKIDRLVGNVKEKLEENDSEQGWKTFNLLLFLSYEHFESQDSTFNLSYLRQGELVIKSDIWLRKHFAAAQHILYSMWAHTYLKMGLEKPALNYVSKTKPYNELSDEDKAFLLGTKAYFFMMYGPPGSVDFLAPGNPQASEIFSDVLELEKNEPEWYYLTGKCLARMRRLHYRSLPSPKEISSFKKAVEMKEDCARYLVHLARSEADFASVLKHNKTSMKDYKVVHALETDVESLLRKAARLPMYSSHLICHVAKSFMKLSYYYRVRNLQLTQFCVMKATEFSPLDPLVNHTVGLYCLTQGDVQDAAFFLTEASNMGVYGASFDLCRLKWRECRGYDPVPDLNKIIENNDQLASSEAHCLLATYYFFIKYDLVSTVEHWKQWLHSRSKESYPITSVFLGQESFDFSSVLYDEVRLEMVSNHYNNLKDRLQLEEVLEIIRKNRPELELEKPWRQRQHLIDKAQMVSRLGRAFPDSIFFQRREQQAKRKNKSFTKEKYIEKYGKKAQISTKFNAFRRDRNSKSDAGRDREKGRSSSTSRVHEYRKEYQKPFWRPPRRHGSVESMDTIKLTRVGSGRVSPGVGGPGQPRVKSASTETLLLLKSYERKGSYCKNDEYNKSSFGNRRTGSHESLTSNVSSGSGHDGRRGSGSMGSRTRSSDHVSRTATSREPSTDRNCSPLLYRTCSSEQISSAHLSRRPSADKDVVRSPSQTTNSGGQPPENWRRGENSGGDQASPRSELFQSFTSRNTSDNSRPSRPSSGTEGGFARSFQWNKNVNSRPSPAPRASTGQDVPTSAFFSRNNRDQGNNFRPSSHSSVRQENAQSSAFYQSGNNRSQGDSWRSTSRTSCVAQEDQHRSGGRGNYTPRGGSFSRGRQRKPGGHESDSRDALSDSFKRLNFQGK